MGAFALFGAKVYSKIPFDSQIETFCSSPVSSEVQPLINSPPPPQKKKKAHLHKNTFIFWGTRKILLPFLKC